MTPKFCKDCKFYDGFWQDAAECHRLKTGGEVINPVTGKQITRVYTTICHESRISNDPRECGPEARHFKPSMVYQIETFFKRKIP